MWRYWKPWLLTSLALVQICAASQDRKGSCSRGTRVLLTGRPDGYYYKVGKAIADAAQEQCNAAPTSACLRICAEESDQTLDNIQELAERSDDIAFAIVQGDVAHDAWYRQPLPRVKGKDVSFTNVRLVTPLYVEAVHILLRPHLNITTLAGLRGKRVWLGPEGSSTEFTARRVLSSVGLDPHPVQCEPLEHPVEESDAQVVTCIKGISDFFKATRQLKESKLDALFKIGPVPSSDIGKVVLPESVAPDDERSEFQILPFDYDLAHRYAQDGGYVERLIQKDSYGQRDSTLTIGVPALLLTNLDKQDEDVAWLANLIREHRQDIEKRVDVKLGLLDLQPKESSFVLHPMAAHGFFHLWRDWVPPVAAATLAFIWSIVRWRQLKMTLGQFLAAILRHRLSLAFGVLTACYCFGALWLEHLESGVNEAFRSFPMSLLSTIQQTVPMLQSQLITPDGQSKGRIVVSLIGLAAVFFARQAFWPWLKQVGKEILRKLELPAGPKHESEPAGQPALGQEQPS